MEAASAQTERVRCCTRCRAIYRSDFMRCPTDGAEIAEVDGDPLLGQTLGDHYVVDACIAEGAMGRVYRAHHVRLERKQFAIKVLIGDLASTLAMRLRFAQEAEQASRLEHPNVVSVADYGKSSSGLLYLVMDYVQGPTLSRILAEHGALEQGRAVTMARGLCRGLAHAHERGLVHRDFKPDNVIVTEVEGREVPRILDFGLAITAGPSEDAARLTNVGVAVGTPIYAAPEQTSAGAIDQRADLFALGITMYEMLAGVTPFVGNLAEVLYLNATADVPPIVERAPGVRVSPALERIVKKLAHRDPAKRFASAREVLDALDGLEVGADDTGRRRPGVGAHRDTEPPPMAEPTAPATRGRGAATLAIALGVLALAIVVGLIVWPRLRGGSAPREVVASVPPPMVEVDAAPVIAVVEVDAGETREEKGREEKGREEKGRGERTGNRQPATSNRQPAEARSGGLEESVEVVDTVDAGVVTPPPPEIDAGVRAKRTVGIDAGVAIAKPRVVDAKVGIGKIDLHGALSAADVRRAVERSLPTIGGCYRTAATRAGRSPAGTARVTMTIDETGQSRGVKASGAPLPGLDGCIAGALGGLRTRSAPDVGTVAVTLDITLTPEAP